MVTTGRFALAATLAPLAAPAVFVLAVLANDGQDSGVWAKFLFLGAAAISYAAFLPLGLPMLLALRGNNALNAINVLAAGTGLGIVLGAVLQMTLPLHGDEIAGLKVSALTLTAISAFIVALAFVVFAGAWRSSNDSIQKNGKQQGTDHE